MNLTHYGIGEVRAGAMVRLDLDRIEANVMLLLTVTLPRCGARTRSRCSRNAKRSPGAHQGRSVAGAPPAPDRHPSPTLEVDLAPVPERARARERIGPESDPFVRQPLQVATGTGERCRATPIRLASASTMFSIGNAQVGLSGYPLRCLWNRAQRASPPPVRVTFGPAAPQVEKAERNRALADT